MSDQLSPAAVTWVVEGEAYVDHEDSGLACIMEVVDVGASDWRQPFVRVQTYVKPEPSVDEEVPESPLAQHHGKKVRVEITVIDSLTEVKTL